MTAQVITLPHRQHFSPVIDLDHRAQVVRFPNLRTRAEIAALDEQLAAIRLGVLAAERRAEELELARMLFEQVVDGGCK